MNSQGSEAEIYEDISIEEDRLVDAIVDFIRIPNKTSQVKVTTKFDRMPPSKQVLAILIAQRLLFETDTTKTDSLSPMEVSSTAETSVGKLYPQMRDLERQGLIQNADGKYSIRAERFEDIQRRLSQ